MKKLISIFAVLALLLALFAGCSVKKNSNADDDNRTPPATQQTSNNTNNNTNTNSPEEPTDDPGNSNSNGGGSYSGFASGTPSDSYAKYLEAKSAAMEKIYDKLDENPDETWGISLAFLPITMVDLSLIPLSVFTSTDSAVITGALEFFSFSNIDFNVSGNTYSLSYDDGSGSKTSLICEYDPDNGSISSSMKDGNGTEIMFFELIENDNGYISQYYYPDEYSGEYTLLKGFFNDDVIAYGIKATNSKPASIIGSNQGVGFIDDCDTKIIMEGDSLTVVEDGTETVY